MRNAFNTLMQGAAYTALVVMPAFATPVDVPGPNDTRLLYTDSAALENYKSPFPVYFPLRHVTERLDAKHSRNRGMLDTEYAAIAARAAAGETTHYERVVITGFYRTDRPAGEATEIEFITQQDSRDETKHRCTIKSYSLGQGTVDASSVQGYRVISTVVQLRPETLYASWGVLPDAVTNRDEMAFSRFEDTVSTEQDSGGIRMRDLGGMKVSNQLALRADNGDNYTSCIGEVSEEIACQTLVAAPYTSGGLTGTFTMVISNEVQDCLDTGAPGGAASAAPPPEDLGTGAGWDSGEDRFGFGNGGWLDVPFGSGLVVPEAANAVLPPDIFQSCGLCGETTIPVVAGPPETGPVAVPPQTGHDVPEPASLALLGSALFGFAAIRRRQSGPAPSP